MDDKVIWDLSEEPGGNCPVQWEGIVAGYLTRLDDLEARVGVVERKTKRFGEETP